MFYWWALQFLYFGDSSWVTKYICALQYDPNSFAWITFQQFQFLITKNLMDGFKIYFTFNKFNDEQILGFKKINYLTWLVCLLLQLYFEILLIYNA